MDNWKSTNNSYNQKKNGKPKIVNDHEGNQYNSIKDMAKSYNINTKTLYARIQSGWSIEKALTLK